MSEQATESVELAGQRPIDVSVRGCAVFGRGSGRVCAGLFRRRDPGEYEADEQLEAVVRRGEWCNAGQWFVWRKRLRGWHLPRMVAQARAFRGRPRLVMLEMQSLRARFRLPFFFITGL